MTLVCVCARARVCIRVYVYMCVLHVSMMGITGAGDCIIAP